MTATDQTQPINYLTCQTIETPVVALPAPSRTAGRHRAPRRSRGLSVPPFRAALGTVWSLVWPPLIGVALGSAISVLIAIGMVQLWWSTL